MKVAVIGDIHGTTKWEDCYNKILKDEELNNEVERIIVLGDWFDPYEYIDNDVMLERFDKFVSDMEKDNRIISCLGNHDLSGYIIDDGGTNRTLSARTSEYRRIADRIEKLLDNSYIVYKINNHLFSHAGLTNTWYEKVFTYGNNKLFNNGLDLFKKGWKSDELKSIVSYYRYDYSGCGDNIYQGPTWVRPRALFSDLFKGYNQVVGHTQYDEIRSNTTKTPDGEITVWFVDNCRKPEYLVINV